MRTVWSVVSGEDETYVVHAVFEQRPDAERYAGEYEKPVQPVEDVRVNRLAVYGPGEQPQLVDVFHALVPIRGDGSLGQPEVSYGRRTDDYMGGLEEPLVEIEETEVGEVWVLAAAWDKQAAISAATERAKQLRAEWVR